MVSVGVEKMRVCGTETVAVQRCFNRRDIYDGSLAQGSGTDRGNGRKHT